MKGTVMVDLSAVWQHLVGSGTEFFDGTEDVIPSTGIEPSAVVFQLIEDFLHLKRSEDGFNEAGGSMVPWYVQFRLGENEDIVPEACLQMAFHLRQVVAGNALPRAMIPWRCGKIETEVHETRRHGRAIDEEMILSEMPTRGRITRVASRSLSLYWRPSAAVRDSVRRTASTTNLASMTFFGLYVGERESSKSAMKTLAPELRALIIIFLSTGPVISTRRSLRSAGAGATFQSPREWRGFHHGSWVRHRSSSVFAALDGDAGVPVGEH